MQVSHVETANTHAIMGGGKARAFGMSQSAEFFTVLSDTLYRDKKRAVAREVICNAWDAHIMVGKTSRPVEITLTDEELTIQDFGPGISDEAIVPIYCVYGESTKVRDENQTGGFGLGSKAPFAYSDHFSVTSCFEGTKTIYAISRGGKETKGVPDMRAMVSVPTEDSGLTVTIPVRSRSDAVDFRRIIRSVVRQGGMKAKLNDELLDSHDYTEARESGFMVTTNADELHESSVYLLYGTVLYPVSSTEDEVNDAVRQVTDLIPDYHRTILVAPPNSVGITPSRDALSYTDKTIATIQSLISEMTCKVQQCEGQAINDLARAKIAKMRDGDRYALERLEGYHTNPMSGLFKGRYASNALDAAKMVVVSTYGSKTSEREVVHKFGAMAAERWRDDRRGLRRAFLAGRKDRWNRKECFATHLSRQIPRLALRAAARADALRALYVIKGYGASDLKSARVTETFFRYEAQKVFVIAQSRAEAITRLCNLVQNDHKYRGDLLFFCASIPRNRPKARASLAKEAEKLGFDVVTIEKALPKKPKVEKPKNKFLALDNFDTTDGFNTPFTLEDPNYFVRFESGIVQIRESHWLHPVRSLLRKEFGDVAVIRGAGQLREMEKLGAKDAMVELVKGFKKRAKTRDAQFAALLEDKHVTSDDRWNYHGPVNEARNILDKCPAAFFEFVPARISSKERVLETAKMITTLTGYLAGNNLPDDFPLKMDDLRALKANGRKTFAGDISDSKEFVHRWKHLDLIYDSRIQEWDQESQAMTLKLIRTLKCNNPMPGKETNI